MITTGLKAYPDDMPPHLMQFGLPLEQTEVLAQITVGRADAQRLRANNPARLPAVVPTKGYDWQGGSLVIPKAPWLDGPLGGLFRPTRKVVRKSPPGPTPAPPGAADVPFEPGEAFVWLAAETSNGVVVGTELKLGPGCFASGT